MEYRDWLERHLNDPLFETLHRERAERLWQQSLLFEILLVLKTGQETLLADSIDSLSRQYHDGWRISIFAQTASPEVEFTNGDSPVRWFQCSPGETFIDHLNERLIESPAHWFGLFECGTRFSPELFLMLGDYIAIRPHWRLIYTDEDSFGKDNEVHSPRFKPDFNLELMRSTDYVGSFFIEKNTLISAGGFSRILGAERYDLLLRTIDAHGEAVIGHIPEVPVHLPEFFSMSVSDEGATQALYSHFERRKIPVNIVSGLIEGETRHVEYFHEKKPKVSIIIPTRNHLELLEPCVGTLLANTFYPDFELLLVDNDSGDPNVMAYYEKLRELVPGRIQIIRAEGPFDFSAMNNRAARQARGEYLLLLNNDTGCIHGEWLDAMMSHAQRPDVGIVGARLLFPKNLEIQHAGLILGLRGCAGHVFRGAPHDAPSYMNRALVDQEYSAVTGACLLIRASIYHEVAGLEAMLTINLQDIDLCLRVKELGYRIVWTPFATLLHHGFATLRNEDDPQKIAIIDKEAQKFRIRWKHRLPHDPAWNRNLSLDTKTPTPENELVVPWNPDFHDRPRILVMPNASPGTTEYRNIGPLRALNAKGHLRYAKVYQPHDGLKRLAPTVIELDRLAPDVLLIQAPIDRLRYPSLLSYKESPDIFRIYSLDDLVSKLPKDNPVYSTFPADVVTQRIRLGLNACHRLIVNTEPLFQAYRDMIDDIRLVPNSLEWKVWGQLQSKRRQGKKLRVGWTGAQQHAGDLRFIPEVVKASYKEVDWVFFGMIPKEIQPYVAEFHGYHSDFDTYPAKLASLDLDLAIAPLEIHPFNEAKSNLHLLEYGALGWPVICTDIFPYQTDNPPVTRLPNDPARWIAAIRERIGEPEALAREGDALREWVKAHYLLENRLDQWLSAVSK
jgi:GT2 family glycosyltransferase